MIGYTHFTDQRGNRWRFQHNAIIPLSPPHAFTELTAIQGKRLVCGKRAYLIRWPSGFEADQATEWWEVVKDTKEDISTLSKNTRNQVRRGAKGFDVSACSRDEVCRTGYPVYSSAFERYETFEERYSEERFKEALNALPDSTEFWGAWDKESGELQAFGENYVQDNSCLYVTMWIAPQALKRYAGYILVHRMNEHYLNDRDVRYVSDGSRNLSHQTGIHQFLQDKFHFRKAYSYLNVVYAPGVDLLVRLLYPFRCYFGDSPSGPAAKVKILLEQERIRRACKADRRLGESRG